MAGEIFGPVESRRFGYSLGINHLPEKTCSYACVYCQLGRTHHMSVTRQPYGDPDLIFRLVETRLKELSQTERMPDTITLVPNGEPTLDKNIKPIISRLKAFGIPLAVITNSSLLWQDEVRKDLADADIVSVKVDSVDEKAWKKINRPHGSLGLGKILDGIRAFTRGFKGKLITESMLVGGMNDDPTSVENLAQFLMSINLKENYLSLPLRPPAEAGIQPPGRTAAASAAEVMRKNGVRPILLGDLPESDIDEQTGGMDEIVDIIKVHPLTKKEILKVLQEKGLKTSHLDILVADGIILEKSIQGKTFYAFNHERE